MHGFWPLHLVWELYASHRSTAEYAREKDISLSFIPAGQTGNWQPLDVSVFGPIKARAASRMIQSAHMADYSLIDALVDLSDLWYDDETERSVKSAWKNLVDIEGSETADDDSEYQE